MDSQDGQSQRPLAKIGASSTASTTSSPFTDDLRGYVNKVMDEWKVPGLAVAVVDGDQVYTEGFGYAELPDTKVTPETLFFAGSTTKTITAAALAHMIDSKNYSSLKDGWSTPISSIIRDDFVVGNEWTTAHLTLDDAVSHRTGMAPHDFAWMRTEGGMILTPAEMVKKLRALKLSAEPRTVYQYCHHMYVALGHVIETLSGQWLGDYLRKTIFEPLSMTATYCDTQDAMDAPEHLASGYYWDAKRREYGLVAFDSMREGNGAGFVISNVVDYAKWLKCLLYETEPFSKQSHKDIRKPRMLAYQEEKTGPGEVLHGLGWQQKVVHGVLVYMYGATEAAYATQVYWLPELKYGLVTMANVAAPGNAAEETIAWKMVEDKLGVPENERFDISGHMKAAADRQAERIRSAADILYPIRPDRPLPSPLNNSQLVGTYIDEGYGVLRIDEEGSTDAGQATLIARRSDMVFNYQLRFRHVSGSFWVVEIWYDDTRSQEGFWGGEFRVGVDGNASGLMVHLSPEGAEIDDGFVWFERVT
ncbi:MAG: hypothetical protein Q9185_002764 [Variospora sp. 1 TL-2023]